jgi:hypothetical protein
MSQASTDARHPAVRNSVALDRLLKRIYGEEELRTPVFTRPASPGGTDADLEHATGRPGTSSYDLTSGTTVHPNSEAQESPFVAERPLQELAADIDALFGLNQDDQDLDAPLVDVYGAQNPPAMASTDVFETLFNYDDRDLWCDITPMPLG